MADSTSNSGGAFDWLVQMIQHIVSQQSGGSATPPVVVPPVSTNEQPKAAKADAKPAPAQQQQQPMPQATPSLYAPIQPLANVVPMPMQGMPMISPVGMTPAPNLIGPQPKASTGGATQSSKGGNGLFKDGMDAIGKALSVIPGLGL